MIKPTSESDRIIKWTARPPWRAMTTNPYWTLGTGMSPHARTHAHARTGTRPGAIGTNGTPDHNWRNLHNWRKFRHWRNCRDWANWHTYVPHAQLAQLARLAGLTLAIVRTFARPECASLRIFLRPYPQAGRQRCTTYHRVRLRQ